MDTDKVILEMYGEVKSISSDVKHVRTKYDTLDQRIVALHDRVDCQDKFLNRLKGGIAVMVSLFTLVGYWIKSRIHQ